MKLIAGYPFSLIRYGLPFNYPLLDADIATDVVIIGGGISGALMAYHLLKENIDCIVIDGRTIGLGSTCASTSLLQYEIDTPLSELEKKIGKNSAVTAYKLCGDAIDKLGEISEKIGLNEFERKESLFYAEFKKDDAFLKKEYQVRKENGFDVQLLDETAIQSSFHFKSSSAILSAKAAQTNAYCYTHALLQYSIKNNLRVFDRTRAEKITDGPKGINIKTNRGNSIKAKKIIYANGYEAVGYINKKIVDLTSTYAVCSEQLTDEMIRMSKNALLWSTGDPYLYMRLTEDNRILIGGKDEKYNNPVKRDKVIEKKSRQLVSEFKKMFPGAEFIPEFSWAGTFGSTKDGLPYIGKYKKAGNSYFALGFGGNGITFSLIAAEILSNELKGKSKITNIFSFDR